MVVFKFKELSVILKIISLYLICVSLIFHTTCISNSKKKIIAIWGFTSLSYEFQLHAKSKTMIFFKVDSQDSDATRLSSQETTQTEDRGYYSNFDSQCYLCALNKQNTCLMKMLWLI